MKNMIAIDNNQLLKEALQIKEYGLNGFDSMFLVDIESGTKCKTILKNHVAGIKSLRDFDKGLQIDILEGLGKVLNI